MDPARKPPQSVAAAAEQDAAHGPELTLAPKRGRGRPPLPPRVPRETRGIQIAGCGECGYAWVPKSGTPSKCPRCQRNREITVDLMAKAS